MAMESMNVNDRPDIEIQSVNSSANSSRKFSKVWNDFDIVEGKSPNKKQKAQCKHCGKLYSYAAGTVTGTSNLLRHQSNCPKRPNVKNDSGNKKVDQQAYRELVAKAIIKHGYTFTWVEHEANRDIHFFLNNTVETVSRNTIKAECLKLHKKMKETLKSGLENISGRICLTSDLWTSCTNRGYLCLTAHYVDESWKLHSKILNFCHVPPPHKANALCSTIYSLLRDWGIEKKIFSITLDNARNMDNMQDLLRNKLVQQDALLSRGAFFHIRCCAHILNLIVQDGLKVLGKSLEKVRYGVKFVEASESRMITFKECARQVNLDQSKGLWLDVPTRWNSTYLMLERYLYYYNAFEILPTEDANYRLEDLPTVEELHRFQQIFRFLKPFYNITTLFSGTNYPTANLYFDNVCKIHSNILMEVESLDSRLKEMAQAMKKKFDKYWDECSTVLAFAVILDPRFKLKFVKFSLKKFDVHGFEQKSKRILDQLKKLFTEYEKVASSNSNVIDSSNQDHAKELDENLKEFQSYDSDESTSNSSQSQLDLYLSEPRIEITTAPFDVLTYWKDKYSRYPELANMARDILSIPITTVASESTFSVGGRVLNKWRSSLSCGNAQILITTRNWLYGYEAFEDEKENFEINGEEIDLSSATSLRSMSMASEQDSNIVDQINVKM